MRKIVFEKVAYHISDDVSTLTLTSEDKTEYLQLLDKVLKQPKAIYQKIQDFAEKHLEIPEVINLLTFAHIQNKKIAKAESLIATTFLTYPDYFFARINFADQCLRKKNLAKFLEAMPSFDLSMLCPGKTEFRTSELRGFFVVMAYYHLFCKQKDKALYYLLFAKKIDPTHHSLLYLEKKVHKVFFLKKLIRFFQLKKSQEQLFRH